MNIYSFIIVWDRLMAELEPNRSLALSNKIDTYIGGNEERGFPGGFDGDNPQGGPEERRRIGLLTTALNTYNRSKTLDNRNALFKCLLELMKTTPNFFSSVLRSTAGVDQNLNSRLMEIFLVESRWHTYNMGSREYDESRGQLLELKRLRYCSTKLQVPSLLFLDFLLYVCNQVDLLTQIFNTTIRDGNENIAVEEDLNNEFNKSILCIINLIGRISRVSDNDSVLNIGYLLHSLEFITPESIEQVRDKKEQILAIYRKWIIRFGGRVTPSSLSLSSTIGTLCDEIVKRFIPEDASGYTQEPSPSPEPRGGHIKLRDERTVQLLNTLSGNQRDTLTDEEIKNIAIRLGWCPFLFNPEGCIRHKNAKDGSIFHRVKFFHPKRYISRTPCRFDVCSEKAVKQIMSAQGHRVEAPYNGGKSLKISCKSNKRRLSTKHPSTKHSHTKHSHTKHPSTKRRHTRSRRR
jgi:hypothetical protein